MRDGARVALVLGAIGGFTAAIVSDENVATAIGIIQLDPFGRPLPHSVFVWYLMLMLQIILIGIGFLGLWRKSGNFIPLVSAIFIYLQSVEFVMIGLWTMYPYPWLIPDPNSLLMRVIFAIIVGVAWFTAGISAWLLREEISRFAIVAALGFVIFAAVMAAVEVVVSLDIQIYVQNRIWITPLTLLIGILVGIFFLDAARRLGEGQPQIPLSSTGPEV